LNAALKPFGIDHSRWRVLAVLNEHAGCSMLELAEHSSVDRTTLAHTVRLMCEEGLVSRARHPTDRRRSILNLSKKGQGLLRSVLPLVVAQNEAAVRSLGRAEADTLLALLVRVADTLKSDHTGRRRRPH
jgi:DNA-binding MarR family transcriptional regulator